MIWQISHVVDPAGTATSTTQGTDLVRGGQITLMWSAKWVVVAVAVGVPHTDRCGVGS